MSIKIKVVSVASESVAAVCRDVTVSLEDTFDLILPNAEFGANISEFVLAIVAVDEDAGTNEIFCKPHNKVGQYKHWQTHDFVKYISLALPFDPVMFEEKTESQVKKIFCDAVLARLNNPGIKLPRGFDYARFTEQFSHALQKISSSVA